MKTLFIALIVGAAVVAGGCKGKLPPSGYVTSTDRFGVLAARTYIDPERLGPLLAVEQLTHGEYQDALAHIADDMALTARFQLSYEREMRRIAANQGIWNWQPIAGN